MRISGIHHVAIICSDYEQSRKFYTELLGFRPVHETFRANRKSIKLDLEVAGRYQIELFSFPDPPSRLSYPEACGLRHLAFEVDDIESSLAQLTDCGIRTEQITIDPVTGKRHLFFYDPDGLPLELYEK